MIQHYQKEITVSQFECDFKNNMKLSAVLRQVEQVSMDNCTAIGIDADLYAKTKSAFLLSRLALEYRKRVTVGDALKLVTTAALPIRAVYHRYTGVYDASGEEAVGVDTRWVLVNTETRRIYRKPPDAFDLPFLEQPEQENSFDLKKSDSLEKVAEERAEYSRTDINRHLNNAEYADLICNHLPVEVLEHSSVKRLVIYYQNELPLGDTIEIYRSKSAPEQNFYFTGVRKDGKTCFEANIEFWKD